MPLFVVSANVALATIFPRRLAFYPQRVILEGRRLKLRPATPADLAPLSAIRREPEVLRRWGEFTLSDLEEEFIGVEGALVIEADERVVGGIEFEEETDPMYHQAGIDIFLGESHQRSGYGPEAIRLLARHLFDERGHHRLSIDPAADNEPAIKAYERVGFKPVGVMRSYERGLDGTWHDNLLMDMLSDELID